MLNEEYLLNIDKLSKLQMAGSSLFHSDIVEGKKEFCYVLRLKRECCVHFLRYEMSTLQELNGKGIGMLIFKNFTKKTKFSTQTSKSKGF